MPAAEIIPTATPITTALEPPAASCKRPSGSTARRSARRGATQQVLAAANRTSNVVLAKRTSKSAALAIRKIELAGTFADCGEKYLRAINGVDDATLAQIANTKPTALAIVAGICAQNVVRLSEKAGNGPLVNIDLGSLADSILSLKASGQTVDLPSPTDSDPAAS